MGNKRLIAAIIIVIALIAAIIGGYFYLQNNSRQAAILQEEMKKLAEMDILNDEINMEIKTNGKYAVVEETIKDYLNDVRSTYLEAKEYCNDEEVSKILSPENIQQDSTGLTVVEQQVEEYKNNLENLKNKAAVMADESNIIETIEQKNLKDSYVDVYKNIMLNEAVEANLENAKQQIDLEIEKAEEKVEGLEKVVKFLKNNKNYWDLNDGKIQFTNVNKLAEYYQLLNNAM